MCTMGKVASCEISFIPIESEDYIADVNRVLAIIESYNLEHTVGPLSTSIIGEESKIFHLIRNIYDSMSEACRFKMDIKISNIPRAQNIITFQI